MWLNNLSPESGNRKRLNVDFFDFLIKKMIGFYNIFLDFLNFIVMIGGATYFSRFIGAKISPSWLGYGLGFIVGLLGFGIGARLINFILVILVDWDNLDFVFFGWLRLTIYILGFIGVSSIMAVLWHRTNHTKLAASSSANIIWTIAKMVSSTTIGAIAGTIVAVVVVIEIWIVAEITGNAWSLMDEFYVAGIFFGGMLSGAISGAIAGAIIVTIIWEYSWLNISFGAMGGGISGAVSGTIIWIYIAFFLLIGTT